MSVKNIGNRLQDSTSPYLQQHANNPVNWQPWDDIALNQAKKEDKPIILSIGYSACHWCHVMEHQSFENERIAKVMNDHFVCIKVDREERPDVDQVYMDAIQAMGLRGGWPLNVFLMPDQKPFYGGTYFPSKEWKQLLKNVAEAFQKNRAKLEESANDFTESLKASEIEKFNIGKSQVAFDNSLIDEIVGSFAKKFDKEYGGIDKEPKFPMPSIWNLLIDIYQQFQNKNAGEMAFFTLDKIAAGGIYDHIGGGFARYAVDGEWHIPHFEKMLYDNGQLLSLYAKAYQLRPNDTYSKIILQTIEWLSRELTSNHGGFYAALDADSEGKEGKFYSWSYEEFLKLAGQNHQILAAYFDVRKKGNWENGQNHFRLLYTKSEILEKFNVDNKAFDKLLNEFVEKSLLERNKRIKPGLDDKIITSWNGLILKGLVESYKGLQQDHIKQMAIKNGEFILHFLKNGNKLIRSFHPKETNVESKYGYLEDYTWVIDAFIALYQITLEFKWLNEAKNLSDYVIDNFYDQKERFFFYTDINAQSLIARKKELFDNVIPSSNAGMALNLFKLGHLFGNGNHQKIASEMVDNISSLVKQDSEYLAYWGSVLIAMNSEVKEVIIVSPKNKLELKQFYASINDHTFLIYSTPESRKKIPLIEGKSVIDGQTTYYVCQNKTCGLPVTNIEDAIKQLNRIGI